MTSSTLEVEALTPFLSAFLLFFSQFLVSSDLVYSGTHPLFSSVILPEVISLTTILVVPYSAIPSV